MQKFDLMCERFSSQNSDGGTVITNKEIKTMMEEWSYLACKIENVDN